MKKRGEVRGEKGKRGGGVQGVSSKGDWETMGEDEGNWGSKGRRGGSKKGKWE